jgi:transposase InsO family protein
LRLAAHVSVLAVSLGTFEQPRRGLLKSESLHRHDFGARRAASDEIMAWLTNYNHTRLHSTLGYPSPMAYEKKWLARKLADAT